MHAHVGAHLVQMCRQSVGIPNAHQAWPKHADTYVKILSNVQQPLLMGVVDAAQQCLLVAVGMSDKK